MNRQVPAHRTPRAPRRAGLAAALVALAGFVVVPTSVPSCTTTMEECGLVATAVSAPGARCSMDDTGLGGMPCCVEGAAPGDPQPAPDRGADAGLRLQLQALPAPPAAGEALLAAAPPAALAPDPAPDPGLRPVPLYTLLSVLLT